MAPSGESPDYPAYQREMEALTKDLAIMGQSMGTPLMENVGNAPSSLARFQGKQLTSALQLNEAQEEMLSGTLGRYYAEGFARQLNRAVRPQIAIDAWERQRDELSRSAFAEIQAILPPRRRADFERPYGTGFLWSISVGGKQRRRCSD